MIRDYIHVPEKQHAITLCANDYLGVVNHDYVVSKQIQDLKAGAGRNNVMSPLSQSTDDPHWKLEEDLSKWFGKECCLVQSGYAANVGLMHAILEPGTHVYADIYLHVSFYDGFAAKKANVHFNKANDTSHLESNIQQHGAGIILVDALYSSTGTYCPLQEIVRIKKRYGCVLLVDESHTLGACHSKGYVYLKGLADEVDFITASLAKAYATRAGIIFASNISFVKENSFTYIFSAGLLRNDIVRIRAMWEVVKDADDRRRSLLKAAKLLRDEMSQVANVIKEDGNLPSTIICLSMKNEQEMVGLHRHLSRRGILATPFCAPATPRKFPILRMSVHCNITAVDVSRVKQVVSEYFSKQRSKL